MAEALRPSSAGVGLVFSRLIPKAFGTNRRYYTHDQYLQVIGQKAKERDIVVYYRVSSVGQKADLASQKATLEQFCMASGRPVALWLSDNGLRKYKKQIA